ncbi:MAG: hypothetical protein ACI9CV_000942 [Ilumatobacter sp.]|jgi:hypothetical protein
MTSKKVAYLTVDLPPLRLDRKLREANSGAPCQRHVRPDWQVSHEMMI